MCTREVLWALQQSELRRGRFGLLVSFCRKSCAIFGDACTFKIRDTYTPAHFAVSYLQSERRI